MSNPTMSNPGAISPAALVLAAALTMVGSIAVAADAQYPNWKGQWDVAGSTSYSDAKRSST